MLASTRQSRILSRLHRTGEVDVASLAAAFGVSAMTIRRDLDVLASRGRVARTHGGAALAGRVVFDFQFLRRTEEQADAKARIAAVAAGLVRDGQSVLLDSGTTTLAIARTLRDDRRLTVITTSLPIASELQYASSIELVLLGGTLRREAPDLIGPLTETNLEALRADIAFVGADAVGPDGAVYNRSLAVARMLGRLTAAARRVYVVADHTKLGQTALARFGNVARWDGLITDWLPADLASRLRQADVQVIGASARRQSPSPAFAELPESGKQT